MPTTVGLKYEMVSGAMKAIHRMTESRGDSREDAEPGRGVARAGEPARDRHQDQERR